MKFMLIITWDEAQGAAMSPAQLAEVGKAHHDYVQQLIHAGKLLSGERLALEREGTKVRVRANKRELVDGPFTETKEAIGGFYVLECATKEEAIDWAARCPSAHYGTIEVRRIEPPGM